MHFQTSLFVAVGLSSTMVQAGYTIADDYMDSFFDGWNFFTGDDPTNGYVNYVDQSTASSAGYTRKNDDGSIYIGVDHQNVASGRGRDSVRLSTKKAYTHMLAVVDIGHMPGGICGTWPAFWTFGNGGDGWPSQGEIDIIEGANDQNQNYQTLHSSTGCSIGSLSQSLVQSSTQNCDSAVDGNVGCAFHDPNTKSYGSGFNSNGGGTYAMEWSSAGVNMWFFARGAEPSDILSSNPDPNNWGEKTATWGGDSCDWDSHFMEHNLVFDTTFCGDWGSNTFDSCSAANNGQTCQQFVQNNPAAFRDAYWQINALKVYQENGQTYAPAPSSASNAPQVIPTQAPILSATQPLAPATTLAVTPSTAYSTGSAFLQTPVPSEVAPIPASTTPSLAAPPPPKPESSDGVVEQNSNGQVFVPSPPPSPSQATDFVEEAADGTVYDEVGKRSAGIRPAARKRQDHIRQHAFKNGLKHKMH